MISKDTEAEILRLYHAEKWPVGTVAKQLGLHHTTVQRVLGQTGQTRPVFAYRLVAEDTIEEKIAELQAKKRALARAIVRDDESLLEGLSVGGVELLLG